MFGLSSIGKDLLLPLLVVPLVLIGMLGKINNNKKLYSHVNDMSVNVIHSV
jgi:hypothetical protein